MVQLCFQKKKKKTIDLIINLNAKICLADVISIGYGCSVADAKQKWLVGQRRTAFIGCGGTIRFRQLGRHQQTH